MRPSRENRPLVPAFMALGSRFSPRPSTLESLSLLTVAGDAVPQGLDPPRHRIAELLSGGPLSLAEVAAYVRLPVGVVKVLVADLVEEGWVRARDPVPRHAQLETHFLERVLHGLRAIRSE